MSDPFVPDATSAETETRLQAAARATGHRFQNPDLLLRGLTHASACSSQADAAERRAMSNERMEFLGDALLGAAMAEALYHAHPDADEGSLSRTKSRLVSRAVLAQAFERSGLLEHCRFGPQVGHHVPVSVKANFAEGLLAAVYLDAGWQALSEAVGVFLGPEIEASKADPEADAKNALQMFALEHFRELPRYDSQRSGGPDHAPRFTAFVSVVEHQATGEGTSRRAAEKSAAKALLAHLKHPK